jgi:hypothetical protein
MSSSVINHSLFKMKTQENTTVKETQQLESEGSTFLKPPAFALTAGEDGGGGGGGPVKKRMDGEGQGDAYTMSVTPNANPFKTIPIAFPGQLAWVHSPCYSQELEAIALNAAAGGDFQSAVSEISNTILKLKEMPFRNAEDKENDWAKRMMKDSVLMNPNNMAATLTGSGFPKLVVLTFWNDPSDPEKGGVNYSYFIEISFDIFPKEFQKDEGGGMILLGPSGNRQLDLGHFSKQVTEINEWMAAALEFMKACQAGTRPDPAGLPKNIPSQIKFLLDQAKRGYEGADKAQSTVKEYQHQENESKAEEKYAHENFVTINGVEYEKNKEYMIGFTLNGENHSSVHSIAWFMDKYGADYKLGNCKQLKFIEL